MPYKTLSDFFIKNGIEFFSALPFSECDIINSRKLTSLGFEPRCAVIFLIPYRTEASSCNGNISLYCRAPDYHLYVRSLFDSIIPHMNKTFSPHKFFGFCDSSPIAETSAAAKCGLGVIGDNHRLINEKYGSYVFIGEILTDAPIICTSLPISYCPHCEACSRACPSPDECMSAFTQKKGELTEQQLNLMLKHDTVWGCDICQTVCPLNREAATSPISFFSENVINILDSQTLDSMSDTELSQRAFGWRGRAVIERNIKYRELHKHI